MPRLLPTEIILITTVLGLSISCSDEDGANDLHSSNGNNDDASFLDLDAAIDEDAETREIEETSTHLDAENNNDASFLYLDAAGEGASASIDFDPEDIEKTVGFEEQTPLGFSAADLLKIIGGTHVARLVWSNGSETEIDFSFKYVDEQVKYSDRTPGRECKLDTCRSLVFQGEGVLSTEDESFVNESVTATVWAGLNTGVEEAPMAEKEGLFGSLLFHIPMEVNGTFDSSDSEIQKTENTEVFTDISISFDANGFLKGVLSVGVQDMELQIEGLVINWVKIADLFFD